MKVVHQWYWDDPRQPGATLRGRNREGVAYNPQAK
jgi:hypothetical protein